MTSEQILALAPDSSSAVAGKGLCNARKWSNLGANERALWGECQGSGSKPYQAQIDTSEPAFKCSCPSRKFPCKHGLGLYLLFAAQPELFQNTTPPEWVEKWLDARQGRVEKAAQKTEEKVRKEADPATAAKRSANRDAKVEGGLHELELWLADLVRNGLAGARMQPYGFWDTMAARLVDAQCPGLARRVRELAGIAAGGEGWQGELLARLAKIHLLVQGWQRRETLTPDLVAELRSQIGWTIKEEELDAVNAAKEEWWVLGQRTEEEEGIRIVKSWLWGTESHRPAVYLQFAHVSQALAPQFVARTRLRAKAVYYPGAAPLRATFRDKSAIEPLGNADWSFALPIGEAAVHYSAALAANPWLDWFPVVLREVVLLQDHSRWQLRDAEGAQWPVSPLWREHWSLLALSGGAPVTLFGEWNGAEVRPYGWALSALNISAPQEAAA